MIAIWLMLIVTVVRGASVGGCPEKKKNMNILLFTRNAGAKSIIRTALKEKFPVGNIAEVRHATDIIGVLAALDFNLAIIDLDAAYGFLQKIRNCISRKKSNLYVIGMSLFEPAFFPKSYFRFGANGYLHKECHKTELLAVIESVLNGKKYISSSLNDTLVEYALKVSALTPFHELNTRELLVTQELLKGKDMRQVAVSIDLHERTTKKIADSVYRKLGIEQQDQDNLARLATAYKITVQ